MRLHFSSPPSAGRLPSARRFAPAVCAAGVCGALLASVGCSSAPAASAPAGARSAPAGARGAALPVLHHQDLLWLQRVTFGIDAASVAQLHRWGRQRYLQRQLHDPDETLPAPIAAEIGAARGAPSRPELSQVLAELGARRKAINAMADGDDKGEARKTLNEEGNKAAYAAVRAELLRAVYSPAQLKEQMVWFWLNHFSVHQPKENLRWLVGDYADRAIRPHALGRFEDLVLATLEHPAMLEYLDNARNAGGHVNENYARELMELHTLGVDGGYTQQDVQQLARVLTGVGVHADGSPDPPPHLKPEWRELYRRDGAFEFNPARHDFGNKVLLGHPIQGRGFAEVEEAVALIVKQPACAHFISLELARYFVADDPPAPLVDRMARTFTRTDGDIAALLQEMFLSPELDASLGRKFKDPMRFVISSVRLAYDGREIGNARPLLNWLNGLGETPFGRPTPDGYPSSELAWASSGQMSRRFEIARTIGSGNAALFESENGAPAAGGFPQLSNRLYYEAIEPFLSAPTRNALDHAVSPQEWNTFLLASPDFNYE